MIVYELAICYFNMFYIVGEYWNSKIIPARQIDTQKIQYNNMPELPALYLNTH